jgi:hypothetical protein
MYFVAKPIFIVKYKGFVGGKTFYCAQQGIILTS